MKGQLTQLVTRLCFIHAVGYLYLYLMAFAVHTGPGMFPFKFCIIYQERGFLLRILVAGERCNVTGEYCERVGIRNSHRLSNVCRRILRSTSRILPISDA